MFSQFPSLPPLPGKSFAGPFPPATAEEQRLARRLRGHVETLAGAIGERNVWHYEALERAAVYVEDELRRLGYRPGRQEYEAAGRTVRNVDATLPGASRADEIVVLGAHYDSVRGSPGANDNGTGVAAVLELAGALDATAHARSIRFVLFVNEEPPFFQTERMGSLVYARRCRGRGEKIVAMLTPETIGHYSDEPGSQRYPPPFGEAFPPAGNFIAFVGDDTAADLVARSIGSFRRHTPFPSEGIAAPDFITGIGFSDHWSFSRVGYPGADADRHRHVPLPALPHGAGYAGPGGLRADRAGGGGPGAGDRRTGVNLTETTSRHYPTIFSDCPQGSILNGSEGSEIAYAPRRRVRWTISAGALMRTGNHVPMPLLTNRRPPPWR